MMNASPASIRPAFALVIGSGGVRSVTALGVYEVLKREGLAPDLIVGCSGGALFGAAIAAGLSPLEAARRAQDLWTPELTRKRRVRAMLQMALPSLARFDEDFALRDDRLILARLARAFGDQRIENLPTALRIATTDATSGQRVVLKEGSLVQALRASVAVPFLFAPVSIGGRRLVDGFISDPLPISAALDARTVLAVGFEAPMPRRIGSAGHLLSRCTASMINNLAQARMAEARSAGARVLRLAPTLSRHVGLFDTAAMPELIELGRREAEKQLPALLTHLRDGPQLAAAA